MSTVFLTCVPMFVQQERSRLKHISIPKPFNYSVHNFYVPCSSDHSQYSTKIFFFHKENLVLQLFLLFKLSRRFPALLLVKGMESARPCLLLGLPFFQPPLLPTSLCCSPLSLSGVILLSSRLRLLWVSLPPLEFLQLPFLQISNPVSFLTFSPSLVTITGYTFMLSKLLVIFHPCL